METVHQRARTALRLLLRREVVLQLLAITAGILVARLLGPGRLGVFGIALFVVTVLGLVTDLGMRTALIRQAAPVTSDQLSTFLAVQMGLVSACVVILFVTAPTLARLYGPAAPELAWVLRALSLDLCVRAWRSMGEVRLERELRYRDLALSDVVASTVYHLAAVGLVFGGLGVWSLVCATITGNLVRTGLLYRASPWPLRLAFHRTVARGLLRTGVPVQVSRAVGLAPGWVAPTLVGWLQGPEAVGLVTWASSVGRKPLEALENGVRVSLPHFARLQDDVPEVERALARYAVGSILACGLWFSVLAVAGPSLVAFLYTERWLPAMPALLVYAGMGPLASVRAFASAALVGIGRVRFNARVNSVVAVLSIAASAVLVFRVGFVGVPLGQLAGVALATPWLLSGIRPGASRRLLLQARVVVGPVVAALSAGALSMWTPGGTAVRGLLATTVMTAVYVLVAWGTGPEWLRSAVREETSLSARLRRTAPRA